MLSRLQQADARQVVEFFQATGHGASPDTSEQGINFLLAAGAQSEVSQALAVRLEKTPLDPYASAVAVEVGCWDPATREQALLDARQWLEHHPAHHLNEYVVIRRDWLEKQELHAQEVEAKIQLAKFFPLMALLIAAIALALGWRFAVKK